LVQRLWRELLDSHGADRLRDRFQRMRSVARARAAATSRVRSPNVVAPTAANVGRSASCPCGSGRKFKRCCGA
jgi:uncharacterized protein YecA (UPF0149 family)